MFGFNREQNRDDHPSWPRDRITRFCDIYYTKHYYVDRQDNSILWNALHNESSNISHVDTLIQSLCDGKKTTLEKQEFLLDAICYLRYTAMINPELNNTDLKKYILKAADELEKQHKKLAHSHLFVDAMKVTCRLAFKAAEPSHPNNNSQDVNVNSVKGNEALKKLGEYRRLQGALRMAFGASLGTAAVLSMFLSGGMAIPIMLAVVALAYTVYELKQPQSEHRLWYGTKRVAATAGGTTAFAMTALTPATMTTTAMVQMTGVAAASIFALVASVFALRKGFYQFFTMTNRGVRDAAGKAFDAGLPAGHKTENDSLENSFVSSGCRPYYHSSFSKESCDEPSIPERDASHSVSYDPFGRRSGRLP